MRLTKSGGPRRFWDEYHDNCCAGRADSDHNYVVVGEMGMFEAVPTSGRKRWSRSMVLSFAAHLLLLGALLYRFAPAFVTPSDVGLGIPHSLGSQSIIYLSSVGLSRPSPLQPNRSWHCGRSFLRNPNRRSPNLSARRPRPRRRLTRLCRPPVEGRCLVDRK